MEGQELQADGADAGLAGHIEQELDADQTVGAGVAQRVGHNEQELDADQIVGAVAQSVGHIGHD